MKITIETIKNKSVNEVKELFYNEFLNYGKICSKYIANKHDMSIEYCSMYIASGLYMLMLDRIEQVKENNEFNLDNYGIMLYSFLCTKKLVKKIMAITNYSSYFKNNSIAYENTENTIYKLPKYKKSKNQYSEYRNIKKVNSHVIDIIDVLEQKENRTSKKNLSLDNDLYEGVSFNEFIISYYPTPEQDLLNKLSYAYSKKYADRIRSDKNYDRILFLKDKHDKNITLSNTENHFLYDFKKRYNLEVLTSKELFYIVSNY